MTVSIQSADAPPRLHRLLGFLERDPENLQLIAEAASAALSQGEPETASDLVGRYAALAPLTPELKNLEGLAALSGRRFEAAASVFEALLADRPGEAGLKFNLAWSKAMQRDFQAAAELIDEAVVDAAPAAASLKVQALHHLGRLEDALEIGAELARRRPDDAALMGALADVALDAEEVELARAYASRAGDAPAGLAALGALELADSRPAEALRLFDRALEAGPDNARALLGRGLALLTQGQAAEAARCIDRSAALFETHLGSWVAAGWTRLINGDAAGARASFEKALALDDSFAETHGALAVLDVMQGDLDSARLRTETALRLDRNCLAGALARSLILAGEGDTRSAERIRQIALNLPVGPGNKTIAQAMVEFGMAAGRPS